MLEGLSPEPIIVKDTERNYVIIGSVDHGMQISEEAASRLRDVVNGVQDFVMEAPEQNHAQMHPHSTELLVKASANGADITYLPGNRRDEDIGEAVLKYVPRELAEVFVPCLAIRNGLQMDHDITSDYMIRFAASYKSRFRFLDIERALMSHMHLMEVWHREGWDPDEMDHFSYDLEKFVGDIREFEFWHPVLRTVRPDASRRLGVCVGEYHVAFVQATLNGEPIPTPNWETHIDTRREDLRTPQSAELLRQVYSHLETALSEIRT